MKYWKAVLGGFVLFLIYTIFWFWFFAPSKKNIVFHLNHIYNLNNYLVARRLHKGKLPYLITPHDSYVYCQFYKKNKPFIKRLYRDIFVYIVGCAALVFYVLPGTAPNSHIRSPEYICSSNPSLKHIVSCLMHSVE